jgi:4-deoxy-L-threo-5-hexosulose-uronate ketol-isomerase
VVADGEVFEVAAREALYIGQGAQHLEFSSVDASTPAKLYFNCAPAHTRYPSRKVTLARGFSPRPWVLLRPATGAPSTSSWCLTCCRPASWLMGMTQLEPGSLWNTMPCHTHDRRMEVYFYFDMNDRRRSST